MSQEKAIRMNEWENKVVRHNHHPHELCNANTMVGPICPAYDYTRTVKPTHEQQLAETISRAIAQSTITKIDLDKAVKKSVKDAIYWETGQHVVDPHGNIKYSHYSNPKTYEGKLAKYPNWLIAYNLTVTLITIMVVVWILTT